jgi:hypothetical protein
MINLITQKIAYVSEGIEFLGEPSDLVEMVDDLIAKKTELARDAANESIAASYQKLVAVFQAKIAATPTTNVRSLLKGTTGFKAFGSRIVASSQFLSPTSCTV